MATKRNRSARLRRSCCISLRHIHEVFSLVAPQPAARAPKVRCFPTEGGEMAMSSSRRYRAMRACVLGMLLAGCQTIPDISTWNQATKDVTSAVTQSFQASAGINGDIALRLEKRLDSKPEFSETAKRYSAVSKALNTRTEDYEKLFGAISDYSASLAAIARASDNSSKTVESVAGSVSALVESLGGTPLVGAGFELGKLLAGELIKIKAASDFADAVQKADAVIGQISDLLLKDLLDLQRTVSETKDEAIVAAVNAPLETQLGYRKALELRRSYLQATVKAAIAPGPQTRPLSDAGNAPSELTVVEQHLRDSDSWYRPYREELDRALAARAKSEQLVAQTRRALEAWRASHASLATAVKERRLPESGRLAALAVRIRSLMEDLKKEKQS